MRASAHELACVRLRSGANTDARTWHHRVLLRIGRPATDVLPGFRGPNITHRDNSTSQEHEVQVWSFMLTSDPCAAGSRLVGFGNSVPCLSVTSFFIDTLTQDHAPRFMRTCIRKVHRDR